MVTRQSLQQSGVADLNTLRHFQVKLAVPQMRHIDAAHERVLIVQDVLQYVVQLRGGHTGTTRTILGSKTTERRNPPTRESTPSSDRDQRRIHPATNGGGWLGRRSPTGLRSHLHALGTRVKNGVHHPPDQHNLRDCRRRGTPREVAVDLQSRGTLKNQTQAIKTATYLH